VLGVLAVVLACAGAGVVRADRASAPAAPSRAVSDHAVRDVATVHQSHLGTGEALAPARTAGPRHLTKVWRIPAGLVPAAAMLAASALVAGLAAVVRGRRLTETPTRLPPRAPPVAGTSVPGHGGGRRPVPALCGAVPILG
jgi:hypothetical protein